MHYIVALTGGIGSGKSTITNAFSKLGVPIVDSDIIARQVVEPKSRALKIITDRYGISILDSNGLLNRNLLREHIFNISNERKWLNSLLHPLIQKRTEQNLRELNAPYVIWASPLLIETGLYNKANRVLVVKSSHNLQISRTLTRNGFKYQQIEQIISAQVPIEKRLLFADDVINNNGEKEELLYNVSVLHSKYKILSEIKK